MQGNFPSGHENFDRGAENNGVSSRTFGLTFAAILAVLAIWPLFRGQPMRLPILGLGLVILLVAILAPGLLSPFNRLWTALSLLLSKVSNPIISALMLYFLFTPFALVLRLMKKDLLRLSLDPSAASYWIPRAPSGPATASMRNQF